MPSRIANSQSNKSEPGLHVLSADERPVPTTRRNVRGISVNGSQKDLSLFGFTDVQSGCEAHVNELNNTQLYRGKDTVSQADMEGRCHYPVANSESPFWSQGLSAKPMSTVRPQSAMALTSNSSYNKAKAAFPERPPTSLGVVWGCSHKTSNPNQAVEYRLKFPEQSSIARQKAEGQSNGHLVYDDYSCLVSQTHQRSQSYGDGVTLGDGHNSQGLKGVKSDDVYATVAKRQAQSKNTDNSVGYGLKSQAFEQKQIHQNIGKYPFLSGQARGSHEVEHNTGQNLGRDNLAFEAGEQAHLPGEIIPRPASTSLDLRSAWHRLYGNSPDMPLSSRRPSAGDIISPPKTRMLEDSVRRQYVRQQISNVQSPRFPRSQIVKHDPTELVQHLTGPVTTSGHNSSQDVGYTPPHYGSSSQHSQLITIRESPTGQSSSNPEHTSGSNTSSQLSSYSVVSNNNVTTFKPQKKKLGSNLDATIGPASKYPEIQKGNKTSVQSSLGTFSQHRHHESDNSRTGSRQNMSSPNFVSKPTSPVKQQINTSYDAAEFNVLENISHSSSKHSSTFLYADDNIEEYNLKPNDSIFDYPDEDNENDSDTSPLSHSSRAAARRSSEIIRPFNMSPRFSHKNVTGSGEPVEVLPKTQDLLRPPSVMGTHIRPTGNEAGCATVQQSEKKFRSPLGIPFKEDHKSRGDKDGMKGPSQKFPTKYARSRSLDDLREPENESVLSLDIENTILTVEPSDQSEMSTVYSYKGSNSVKTQLKRLEGMYTHVMSTLEDTSHGKHFRRRWSIGSSDTSSLRHHTHQSRHNRMSAHRLGSKDVRIIGKRFQRLESHVITLARSVAHLSSELRAQNSLSREIENVKREILELKTQSSTLPEAPGNLARGNRLLSEYERYQGWVPSLTNPRRVNKLTKFFGQEPPLLEIFLKQLGYEKFLRNFEDEHIGMIELPYMTEERLQSIGIPMGPRLRILQEAQLHFKKGNFDIYFL